MNEIPPVLEALSTCFEAIDALDDKIDQRSIAVFLAERFAPVPEETFVLNKSDAHPDGAMGID